MPKLKLIDDDMATEERSVGSSRQKKGFLSKLPWIIVLIILIAAGVFAAMQYKQSKDLKKQISDLKQNPQKATEEETKALLDKVGQLIDLPSEQPTIATVSDLAPLKDQPFFANAQIGDKVLIFTTNKKAILYRPSTNKIIEVAPVNLDDNNTLNTNSNSAPKTPANTNTSTTNTNTSTKSTNTNTSTKATTNTNTAKTPTKK